MAVIQLGRKGIGEEEVAPIVQLNAAGGTNSASCHITILFEHPMSIRVHRVTSVV
jgi:hypothetical protein